MISSRRLVGRQYHLSITSGAPDAERVLVINGSGAEVAQECVEALTAGRKGRPVEVRLFRPFADRVHRSAAGFRPAIAVLDRTKEPGATGEPLYTEVLTALVEMDVKKKVIAGATDLHRKSLRRRW